MTQMIEPSGLNSRIKITVFQGSNYNGYVFLSDYSFAGCTAMLIVPGIKENLEEGSGAISKLAHSCEE